MRFSPETRAVVGVGVVSLLATIIVAWPVIRSPNARIFGNEIVGRQHDPYTVMQQFQSGAVRGEYWQPLTDQIGAALASGVGPVAAYNILILLTIPFAAGCAYALARFLGMSRLGSFVAAMAYAFAPVHMAHAAYHAHIAQTQWIPLYLLALWACVERPTPIRGVWLLLAGVALGASNFYGGLIGLVVTPVALITWWLAASSRSLENRHLIAAGALLGTVVLAITFVVVIAPDIWRSLDDYAVPRVDLFLHSARWWAYLLPSVEHPLWGSLASWIWTRERIGPGLLEQQVSLSWMLFGLASIAVWQWWRHAHDPRLRWTPVLVVVAAWAWLCSLAPEGTVVGVTFPRPTALMYAAFPMFRAYARFGIVVALMVSLLAGMGAAWLVSQRAAVRWVLCGVLSILLVDLMPLPWRYRDVLPTMGHRWLADLGTNVRALDCVKAQLSEASVPWLMQGRLTFLSGLRPDCDDSQLPEQLSALGYTHVLIRANEARRDQLLHPRAGFHLVSSFADSQVFAVTTPAPAVATLEMPGFYERERLRGDVWWWMGSTGSWRVVNTTDETLEAYLEIELEAFAHARALTLASDVEPPLEYRVGTRARQTVGPFVLRPGTHTLVFRMAEPATVVDTVLRNGDGRAVSIRIFDWRWSTAVPAANALRSQLQPAPSRAPGVER
jgi:hypothetical protein